MDQQILFRHIFQNAFFLVQTIQLHRSRSPRTNQCRIGIRKFRQILQIQMLVSRNQLIGIQFKRIHQILKEVGWHMTVVYKTADCPYLAFLYLLLQLLYHHFSRSRLVIDHDIGISRNLAAITTIHLIPRKHQSDIQFDNVFHIHQVIITLMLRKFHKTGNFAIG